MHEISKFFYIHIVKPFLFLFPADRVHEFFLRFGNIFGRYKSIRKFLKKIWYYENPILEQHILGLDFKNPVGLSAGFDYNADLCEIVPSLGFGFHSVGTLTHDPYVGNPAPMLGRLPKSRSLLVNKGFKNEGIKNVLPRIPGGAREIPLGVSVGATNKVYPDFDSMLADLTAGFRDAEKFKDFDYYELNISCPNLLNLKNLKEQIASPSGLAKALKLLEELKLERPVFIKMPLELAEEEMKNLIETASDFSFIRGLIFSNLVKDRNNKAFDPDEIKKAGKGNFSGKPVEEKSNTMLHYAYQNYKNRFVLIGVGGIFTAEDAYRKILLGASLVELITGMIFMGPAQIGLINKELAELLKKDGFQNIKEAIGAVGKSHLNKK